MVLSSLETGSRFPTGAGRAFRELPKPEGGPDSFDHLDEQPS
jgi:hypothetical protein